MRDIIREARPGLIAIGVAIGLSLSYWPGLLSYDSVRQFDQALNGGMDDWHPPVMAWLWQQLMELWPAPQPMLLLQLALLGFGMGGLVIWATRQGRPRLALALGCTALLPIPVAMMGAVQKDSLMGGALMAAVGLLALAEGQRAVRLRLFSACLVLFAVTLRFNAFCAGLPLLVALVPEEWRRTPGRMLAAGAVSLALLLAAMPVANGLIRAHRTGVEFSLVIFDLGGISENAEADAFPPLGVPNALAASDKCYTPRSWDNYSWWVKPQCPIGFYNVRRWFWHNRSVSPMIWWLQAVVSYPEAYVRHRLAHWNLNARFLIPADVERPVHKISAPNPWGFTVDGGMLVDTIDAAAINSAMTPLGWPCVWMALCVGPLLLGRRLQSHRIVVPIAASALLYGLGYGVFSVASELRYYLWTMTGGAVAIVIAVADLGRNGRLRDWVQLFAPGTAVSAAAIAARVMM